MEHRHSLHLFWIEKGQSLLAYLAAGIGILFLFVHHLRSLVPGFAALEVEARLNSSNLSSIMSNPINVPHKLLQYGLLTSGHHGPWAMRGVSVIFGCIIVALFFYILRSWYTLRVAIIGTLLFATSSWLLHIGRFATPFIMQTMVLSLIAYGTWLKTTQKPGLALLAGSIIIGLSSYIPGLLWLILIALMWQRKVIYDLVRQAPVWASVAGLLCVGILLPLGVALSSHPTLFYALSGIPALSLHTLTQLPVAIKDIMVALLWSGPKQPELWLVGTPMLDVFTLVMVGLGVYYYSLRFALDRSKLLIGSLLFGTILIALRGSVTLAFIWPIIYLFAASGIALMLQQWQTVFPKNPLAKRVGMILLSLATITACFYQLNRYFIAWPQSPATRQVFHIPYQR